MLFLIIVIVLLLIIYILMKNKNKCREGFNIDNVTDTVNDLFNKIPEVNDIIKTNTDVKDPIKEQMNICLFYMNGCPYCEQLEETTWKPFKDLVKDDENIVTEEIEESTATKYHDVIKTLKGYPTIVFFREGKKIHELIGATHTPQDIMNTIKNI